MLLFCYSGCNNLCCNSSQCTKCVSTLGEEVLVIYESIYFIKFRLYVSVHVFVMFEHISYKLVYMHLFCSTILVIRWCTCICSAPPYQLYTGVHVFVLFHHISYTLVTRIWSVPPWQFFFNYKHHNITGHDSSILNFTSSVIFWLMCL